MLKKVSYVLFAIGLLGLAVLGYYEAKARFAQYRMKSVWRQERDTPETRAERRFLKIERKGPKKNQLGVLIIPKINVNQVVLYDSTKANLELGPSLMKKTAFPGRPGNAVIAGHRTTYGFPFRKLNELKKGDKIIFENDSGEFLYRVNKVFKVRPDNTRVLWQTKSPKITLLSCDPPFSSAWRLIVTGTAIGYKN